jgi:PRTRC genetic system protein C
MIEVESITRVFKYNGVTLPDPNPTLPIETVRSVYAHQYPELGSADVQSEIKGKTQIVTFQKVLGHKG